MSATEQAQARRHRVLVVEDHPLVREGIVLLLERQPDLECCGAVASLEEGRAALREHAPDLLVLDLLLKDGNALQMIAPLKAEFPGIRILILSQFEETLHAEQALRAGASGYIMKEEASREVLRAIQSVLRGEIHVSPRVAARLLHLFVGVKPRTPAQGVERLSDRELHVLQLLGSGMRTREIAAEMGLSIKTVETYRQNLKHKLGLSSGAELVNYAVQRVKAAKLVLPGAEQIPQD